MDEAIAADQVVQSLQRKIAHGDFDLDIVPKLLKRLIGESLWRRRFVSRLGREVEFASFVEFVSAPPLEGLGTTVETLTKFCQAAEDREALDLLDQVTRGRQGERTDLVDNINEVERPTGTSEAYALRRLRRQRPDLHAEVLAGAKSPHAAMVEAGFRERSHLIPHDPVRAAKALRRHFSAQECEEIARGLLEQERSKSDAGPEASTHTEVN